MSAQTAYNFYTPKGVAGGLYDISLHDVNSRRNAENDGVLKFGMGVVKGTTAGVEVKKPTSSSTAADFEGVVVNGFTTEHDIHGVVALAKGASVGVLQKGRIWARVIEGDTPAYGDSVYLVISGDDAGLFTSDAEESNIIQIIGAKFIGGVGTGDVAPIEYDLIANKSGVDAVAIATAE